MIKQVSFSFIRLLLGALGGYLIHKGYASADQVPELSGAVMTLISFGWSLTHHTTTVPVPIEHADKVEGLY